MTDEKREKLRAIRAKLAGLTEAERKALPGITTIEGRGLSGRNQCLIHLQLPGPTIVGGFRQWIKANRVVKRGEHGATIFFPVGERSEEGDILDVTTFYTGTVFDVAQTEILDINQPAPEPSTPGRINIVPVAATVHPEPAIPQNRPANPIMAGWQLV